MPRNGLLNPWSTVLLEKLIGPQLVKKFPEFYGTRKFITALSYYIFLSSAKSIQFMPTYLTYWRSILVISSHLRLGLPNGLFPSSFPTKTLYIPLLSRIRAPRLAHLILFDNLITRIIFGEEYSLLSSPLRSFFPLPCIKGYGG